jgi:hypothetical protein
MFRELLLIIRCAEDAWTLYEIFRAIARWLRN